MAATATRPGSATDVLETLVEVAESPIHGLGCFARVPIAQGVHIGCFEGPEVGEDGPYVLWLCEPDGAVISAREGANALRWLNHSDDPNAELDAFELYAVRAIGVGEEITINYRGAGETGEEDSVGA